VAHENTPPRSISTHRQIARNIHFMANLPLNQGYLAWHDQPPMFLCNLCQSFLELLEPTSSQFRSALNLTVREILDLSLRGISLYRAMNSVELVNLVRVGQPVRFM
jgi:hypothetical protein